MRASKGKVEGHRRILPAAVASVAAAVLLMQWLAVAAPAAVDVPFTVLQTLYAQDFEGGDGGFTTGGVTSWQYGQAVSPPTPVLGQGPSMWGTNLTGDYGDNECGYIQSPSIDLSSVPVGADLPDGIQVARLSFRQWMFFEDRYDAGMAMASADGQTWKPIAPVGGYPSDPFSDAEACFGIGETVPAYSTPSSPAPAADAWTMAAFDVTEYLGGALHLRWVFASDSSIVKRGWYVDDVTVQLGVGANLAVELPAPPSSVEVPFTAAHTLYAEDFEATDGGWISAGSAWEWGQPADPPTALPGSLKVWGTRLLGDYLPNECSSLTSPSIDVPGAAMPARVIQLSFDLWRSLEVGYDGALLQASTDNGATWKIVTPIGGYDRTLVAASTAHACLGTTGAQPVWNGPTAPPGSHEWSRIRADLTPFAGAAVKIRFLFGSDVNEERRGVYVDDVLIQAGVGASVGNPGAACPAAPGWTSGGTNSTWCYGSPTTGPFSAYPVFATNLGGNYSASECSAITSPPVATDAVPGLGALTLTFEHFMQTASSDDGGVLQVSSDDGGTWQTVTPVGGYPTTLSTSARNCVEPTATTRTGFSGIAATTGVYQLREAHLNAFQGKTIRVRFIFGSGASNENLGWYLRTIGLNRGAGNVVLMA